MARRCTTVPGYGTCCAAAQQGALGRPFKLTTRTGSQRCAQCDPITKRNGAPGFRFRWHKSSQCGIGPSGCPALAGQGPSGGQLSIPQFGQ